LDANGHTVGIEIRDLQRDHLADPQTGGVGRREQEAVPGVRAGIEQAPDFLAAEDLRQLLRLLGGGDVEVDLRVAERHMVEEPEGVRRLAARAPGQLALLDQVSEVGLHLVVGELIRRPLVVLRQLHHLADVGLVGAARETAQRHVADHAGTKLAHGNTSSEGMEWNWRECAPDGSESYLTVNRRRTEGSARAANDHGRIDVRPTALAV